MFYIKSILVVIIFLLGVSQARAEITAVPFVATGPNLRLSPDAPAYINNLFTAIQTGATQVGPVGMPASFTLGSFNIAMIISTPTYHSWGAQVNPPDAPFSSQYGGSMVIGAHVFGNGTRFLPQQVTFDLDSNDSYRILNSGKETISGLFFSSWTRGAIYNPDGTKTWYTSGPVVPVDEFIFFEGKSLLTNRNGTPQELHDWILSFFQDPFDFRAEVGLQGAAGSSGNFDVLTRANIQKNKPLASKSLPLSYRSSQNPQRPLAGPRGAGIAVGNGNFGVSLQTQTNIQETISKQENLSSPIPSRPSRGSQQSSSTSTSNSNNKKVSVQSSAQETTKQESSQQSLVTAD